MFRLFRLLLFVGFGAYLGFKFSDMSMRSECSKLGEWRDGLCLVTEIPK